MGEDKDMKKIISIFILLLSLTGLYALNPPAWMMGYWFDRDSENVAACQIMRVTPDNIIFYSYYLGGIDVLIDLNEVLDEASDFSTYVEQYTDDTYIITCIHMRTFEELKAWSFTHDKIDNKIIYHLKDNGEWIFGWPYGREKPGSIPEALLP